MARLGVALATRVLPTPQDRARYRDEFLAELDGLPAGAQLRYTAGILTQALALRAALGSADRTPMEATVPTISLRRRFLCRVLRWHDWRLRSTDDGGRYRVCTYCRTEDDGPRGPLPTYS